MAEFKDKLIKISELIEPITGSSGNHNIMPSVFIVGVGIHTLDFSGYDMGCIMLHTHMPRGQASLRINLIDGKGITKSFFAHQNNIGFGSFIIFKTETSFMVRGITCDNISLT